MTVRTKNLKIASSLGLALAAMLTLGSLLGTPADADDTDLFRANFGKPYLFIFFDTSSSMNTVPGDQEPAPGNGDDPTSTFFQAKKAFYEVFHDVYLQHGDVVHYGFASYNKDETKIKGKNWLYQVDAGTASLSIGGVTYPAAGEQLVFGANFPAGTIGREPTFGGGGNEGPEQGAPYGPEVFTMGELGNCAAPADLSDPIQRIQVNRFPKLHPVAAVAGDPQSGVGSMLPTTLYVDVAGTPYRIVVSPDTGLVGETSLTAKFELFDCGGTPMGMAQVSLTEVQEFFYHEQIDDSQFDLKQSASTHEMTNGYWDYQAVDSVATCGDDNTPHTGLGWEGNYDGYFDSPDDLGFPDPVNPIQPAPGEADAFTSTECSVDPITQKVECNLKHHTSVYDDSGEICFAPGSPEWRARDQGDMIAFNWETSNREAFFRRLAPDWVEGAALADLEFAAAPYFTDVPAADGFLRLKNPAVKPLLPFGGSPIGDSLTDWRCFYLGTDAGGNKCHQSNQPYGGGWDTLAAVCDSEFGCRKIYQIIIGDGENNCVGENPAADTANLRRNRVQSWVINFGGPQASDLRQLAQNTGGEYLEVSDGQALKDELERIAGIILEDVRQFASAAVPAVQADDNDKVFASSFQPVDQGTVGIWPGKLDAFLKPVPLKLDGTPDTGFKCSSDPAQAPRANCHLWDAGEALTQQVAGIGSQFGNNEGQRRVFYRRLGAPANDSLRRYLAPTSPGDPSADRYDLWRGVGLIPSNTLDGSLTPTDEMTHEDATNAALTQLYALKMSDGGTPGDASDDFDYVLGDIFHSDPLVVDQPEGVVYFRQNLFNDPLAADCTTNPGYRCFFLKHQNRRKVMFFGANEGLFHAVDAGIARPTGDPFEGRYDDGTGHEIFAYAPRAVLPTIYSQNSGGPRQWSVDAPPNASDVFIDPADDGGLYPNPADREWRTVLMSGLRRGGRGYFALDITQPDTYDTDGIPEPLGGSDEYVPSCIDGGAGCGPIPYATPLWEFTDSHLEPATLTSPLHEVPFDEDLNGVPDLATSWSDPVMGLMHVCPSAAGANCDPADLGTPTSDIEVRSVAVFGGGLSTQGVSGNYLYIIDVETGQAIYKQPLCHSGSQAAVCVTAGSAPAEPAVVDSESDGFIDRVYLGTRRGYVLRADLRGPSGEVPKLALTPASTMDATITPVVERIVDSMFKPREIFRAAPAGSVPAPSRQIFFRPAAGFLSDLGQYAIAFGTGNRDDLFTSDNQPGRFYVVRDDIAVGDLVTRYSEDDLSTVIDGGPGPGFDTLTESSPTQGWVLLTRPDDRLIATPFQIAGITIFTMFEPDILISGGGGPGGGNNNDPVCSRTGTSRVFAVNTRNTDGLLFNSGVQTRGLDIAGFVVNPALERAGTQNIFDPDDPSSGSTRPDDPNDPSDDQNLIACEDDQDCLLALAEMQKTQPDNCKYGSARHNLPLQTDLLSKVGEIPIPICIIDKNWVEL